MYGYVSTCAQSSAGGQYQVNVSVASDGSQANDASDDPDISADGTTVAFWSEATNLVSGDTNAKDDVFVHDLATGTTERVSVASDGTQGTKGSDDPEINADGSIVAFKSSAANLVAGDTNSRNDIFVHDRASGTTTRVSVAADGSQTTGGAHSTNATIDDSGTVVAFDSPAANLVTGDTNAVADVFVRGAPWQ